MRRQGRIPTTSDLPDLPYTRMVVDETLRLYPSAWITNRRAIQDDTVCGYRIPADAIVSACPYVTHRDPTLRENSEPSLRRFHRQFIEHCLIVLGEDVARRMRTEHGRPK